MSTPVQITLNATGVISLGEGPSGQSGWLLVHIVPTGWTGAAQVKARAAGAGIADANLVTVPYFRLSSGQMNPPGASITAGGLYLVPTSGEEIVLDYTHTAGSALVSVSSGAGPISGIAGAVPVTQTQMGSTARTSSVTGSDQGNINFRGLAIVLDVTAASGTGGLSLVIEGKDSVSGKYYTLLQETTPIIAISTIVYRVYPGLTAVAGRTANDVLPDTWRVRVVHGDGSSYTYSAVAKMLV